MADGFMNFSSPFVPQQQAPDFSAPEVASEEDRANRLGGWAKLQATMQNPDIQMGILKFGLQMMQPVQPYQTPLGHTAAALGSSVDYVGAIREQRRRHEIQAQELANQTELRKAQAEHLQAQSRVQIPAAARLTGAQAGRIEALTPMEVDEATKKLALLDWDIKNAPLESRRKQLINERAAFELELDTKFGEKLKTSELAKSEAYVRYLDALGSGQKALADKYRADADKGKGWRLRNVTKDDESGTMTQTFDHPDGRVNTVTIKPGVPFADAKAMAKREIGAMSDETFRARYPGMKRDAVIEEIAKDLTQTKTDVRTMQFDENTGVPRFYRPTDQPAPGRTQRQQFPNEEAAYAAAVDATKRGEAFSGDAPALKAVPLPKSLAEKGDDTLVPAHEGTKEARVSKWWKKQGDMLVPASDEDVKRIRARAGKGATEPQPEAAPTTTVGSIRNVPAGVSQDVAQRYSKTVRGGGTRFDSVSYEKDMAEFEDLIDRMESGKLGENVGRGRVTVLSHKLGIPLPEQKQKEKGKKVSLKMKRGPDGKIQSVEVVNETENQ